MSPVHLVRAADAVPYDPPLHRGVDARRLQGLEAGGPEGIAVGRSVYAPGGSAGRAPVPLDTVYVQVEGELVVALDARTLTLRAGDSLFLPRGTVREVRNDTASDAVLLVVVASERHG